MAQNVAAVRILAAQARLCEGLTAAWKEAQAAGVSASEVAALEAQLQAARRRYQELSVDLPTNRRRSWWRFW